MTSTKWPPFCKRHFQTHDIKFHWSLLRVLKIQSKHLTNHTYHDKISHNAPFCTEMCTRMHIFVTKWCIVGSGTGALWDLWDSRVCSQRHGTKSYIEKKRRHADEKFVTGCTGTRKHQRKFRQLDMSALVYAEYVSAHLMSMMKHCCPFRKLHLNSFEDLSSKLILLYRWLIARLQYLHC